MDVTNGDLKMSGPLSLHPVSHHDSGNFGDYLPSPSIVPSTGANSFNSTSTLASLNSSFTSGYIAMDVDTHALMQTPSPIDTHPNANVDLDFMGGMVDGQMYG